MTTTLKFLPVASAVLALALLSGCANRDGSGDLSQTTAQMKAANDASKKKSIDDFLSSDREMNVINDGAGSKVESIDLKLSTDNKFELDLKLKDGTSVSKSGSFTRITDSDQVLQDLKLGSLGTVGIGETVKDPRTYCVLLSIQTDAKDQSTFHHIDACESKPIAR